MQRDVYLKAQPEALTCYLKQLPKDASRPFRTTHQLVRDTYIPSMISLRLRFVLLLSLIAAAASTGYAAPISQRSGRCSEKPPEALGGIDHTGGSFCGIGH